jgi:caspase domain-containing protein
MRALVPVTLLAALAPAGLCLGAPSSGEVRRFALVVGANRGAADRVPLRYAVADAERFAEIVTTMGGVRPEDILVVRDPTRKQLMDALTATGSRATAAQTDAARVEMLLYFSGHADDRGLMLGRETLSYRDLREAVHSVAADVGITILDACASGAITRLKGGSTHPAFLSGAANEAKGYAFLTSSSENEAAQESERLRGSFFTHALLTGLRGAADVTGDGKVTLNEAYQFAFNETIAETAATQAGAQHPAYDIKMAGTGDVVMTDLRQTSSSLVLGEAYDGRFLVLDAKRQLVAELYKPAGRAVELGMMPGEYGVYFEQQKQLLSAAVTLADGQRYELARDELKEAKRLPTNLRGGEREDGKGREFLDGKVRFDLGYLARFDALHWIKPSLAIELAYQRNLGLGDRGMFLGARYYPPMEGSFRVHADAGVGAFDVTRYYSRYQTPSPTNPSGFSYSSSTGLEWGMALGVGLDAYAGRHFTFGLKTQISAAGGNSTVDTWVSLGWTFGGRGKPMP